MDGWRGIPGPYWVIDPIPPGGGGGFAYSWAAAAGAVLAIAPGSHGGGGLVPSSAAPLAGYGGVGGPGPGAMIGLGG